MGDSYQIPFSGNISYVHVEDAALRFVAAVSKSSDGAYVFNLDGTPVDIGQVISLIESEQTNASISYTGDAMPFPAEPDNGLLNQFLDIPGCRSMAQGVADTIAVFGQAKDRGVDLKQLLDVTIGRSA
ncbi:MAG TPA: NAD(P)-dependent oxidoreductase [Porticoccaceae bacterium]|nr:NAD(P)-dependent oxidoreductase [Porticoccaceae bacterium]